MEVGASLGWKLGVRAWVYSACFGPASTNRGFRADLSREVLGAEAAAHRLHKVFHCHRAPSIPASHNHPKPRVGTAVSVTLLCWWSGQESRQTPEGGSASCGPMGHPPGGMEGPGRPRTCLPPRSSTGPLLPPRQPLLLIAVPGNPGIRGGHQEGARRPLGIRQGGPTRALEILLQTRLWTTEPHGAPGHSPYTQTLGVAWACALFPTGCSMY